MKIKRDKRQYASDVLRAYAYRAEVRKAKVRKIMALIGVMLGIGVAMIIPHVVNAAQLTPEKEIFRLMTENNYYLSYGKITKSTNKKGVARVKLADGNVFKFHGDGWNKGDAVVVMLDSNGTAEEEDDAVLIVQAVY